MLRAAAEYVMEREAARVGKRIVGDKSPSSTIHGQSVRDLHLLFPDARLIYIVRDGRDVVVSERFRNFVEESRYLSEEDRGIVLSLRKNPHAFVDGTRSIFTEPMLRRVAGGWAVNVQEIQEEGRRLFGARYIAVRYEDLLDDPERMMRRLWRFLGVRRLPKALGSKIRVEMESNPDQEWQERRGEALASFLAKGRSGNWRNLFTARDKAAFKHVAGEMLLQWNYERDNNW